MIKKIINGIDVNYIPIKKFKHVMIGFSFQSKIDASTYNERHMLPSLLEQNNSVYRNSETYNTELDMLYGAHFNTSVFQRGEMLSTQFFIRFINQKYVENTDDLMASAFEFMINIIYRPMMYRSKITKKAVREKLIETEDILKTIHQDKASLAYFNFLKKISSEIHPNHFPIESKLDHISQDTMTQIYHKLISDDALKIYVIGDFDMDQTDEIIRNKMQSKTHHLTGINYRVTMPYEGDMGDVFDESDVSISRLYIGYNAHVQLDSREETMMELLNIIVGGHSQSKLFKTIREEMHLVYYIYSTFITENDMFIIHFECENEDEDKGILEVKKIITNVQNGDISKVELNQARKLLINNYLSVMDHLNGCLKVNILSDLIENKVFDIEDKLSLINSISKDDLIDFSKRLKHHITYRFKKAGEIND
jgi:predicted Zn-dependent peptidase